MQSEIVAQGRRSSSTTRQSMPFLRPIAHDALLKKSSVTQDSAPAAPVDQEFAAYTPNELPKSTVPSSRRIASAAFDVDGVIKEILEQDQSVVLGASHISLSESAQTTSTALQCSAPQITSPQPTLIQQLEDNINIFPEQDEPVFLAGDEPMLLSSPKPTDSKSDLLAPANHEMDLLTSLNVFWESMGESPKQGSEPLQSYSEDDEHMAEDAVPTASMATPMPVPTQTMYTEKKKHTGVWILLALLLLLLIAVGVLWATDTLDDVIAYPKLVIQRLTDQPATTSAPSITLAPKPTIDVGIDENNGVVDQPQTTDSTLEPLPTHSPLPGGGSMNG
ncbi:MAG: hypothetical protein GX096_04730 [Clostridiales bacterium]|nr:hypothetical protein [Clostridiales bacterium]